MSTESIDATQARSREPAGWLRVVVGPEPSTSSAALCLVVCTVMVAPLVLGILASLKSTGEAAAQPPTYLPHALSLDSYSRLWGYQAGLPTYLANSLGTALLTIVFALGLTIPAGYALARFPIPGKELLFVFLLLALIIPYQALLTPMFLMFVAAEADQHDPRPRDPAHRRSSCRSACTSCATASRRCRASWRRPPYIDGGSAFQVLRRVFLPAVVPAIVTVALFAFITSWNELLGSLVMNSRESAFTLPRDPRGGPHHDQPRRHGLGDAPGGHHDLDRCPASSSTCCCRSTTSRASLSGAVK